MNKQITESLINLMEAGRLPDSVVRLGIRRLCAHRLRAERGRNAEDEQRKLEVFIEEMKRSPIAPVPDKANEQHYEVPPEFFALALGPHRKYSSCYWPAEVRTLAEAESASLEVTCERAGLSDGQDILELGCGWGSLTLWMAKHYPHARITAVSNSAPQRQHIEQEAGRLGLNNLRVVTADMNSFDPGSRFDRVVSVEMFEHMRNYEQLLERIAGWLKLGGKLFVHIFCHKDYAYPFDPKGATSWMGRYFFTGGIMPADGLLHRFGRHMSVTKRWRWSGSHYQKTSNAWLKNLDANTAAVMPVLEKTYGADGALIWLQRWRVFFMACAELFGYRGGDQWWVAHYLLEPSVGHHPGT